MEDKKCVNECCDGTISQDRFKHCIENDGGFYFTVYLATCDKCGYVDDENTWVE